MSGAGNDGGGGNEVAGKVGWGGVGVDGNVLSCHVGLGGASEVLFRLIGRTDGRTNEDVFVN